MSSGAVLLKPDMSHVKLAHNIFVPNETYVPLRWDLGNLRESVEDLLASTSKLRRISGNAYDLLGSINKTVSLPWLPRDGIDLA
jgi:hypothetical protein